jgi:predicted nucleotidyltransferase
MLSNIDLLVDLESGRGLLDLISFKQDIEERTGHRVDVVTKRGLSRHLCKEILAKALPL